MVKDPLRHSVKARGIGDYKKKKEYLNSSSEEKLIKGLEIRMTSASSIAILEKNIFRPGRSERFIHSFLRKLLDGEWASLKHGSKP